MKYQNTEKYSNIITNLLNIRHNMKTRLKYLLLCDSAIVDNATGKLTAVGLFDRITIDDSVENSSSNFSIAGQLVFDSDEKIENLEIKITIYKPNGEMFTNPGPLRMSGEKQKGDKVSFVANFVNAVLSDKGQYSIEVLVNNEKPKLDFATGGFEVV